MIQHDGHQQPEPILPPLHDRGLMMEDLLTLDCLAAMMFPMCVVQGENAVKSPKPLTYMQGAGLRNGWQSKVESGRGKLPLRCRKREEI